MAKKSFEEELYRRISLNELILFSIFSVTEKREKCTFERLVKECFTLFPKCFTFSTGLNEVKNSPKGCFPKWPDSRKLDRPLRSLRKRKLIVGNPKASFALTKAGKKIAEEVAKIFRQRKLKL